MKWSESMPYHQLIPRPHSNLTNCPNSAKFISLESCAAWIPHHYSVLHSGILPQSSLFHNLDTFGLDWCFLMMRGTYTTFLGISQKKCCILTHSTRQCKEIISSMKQFETTKIYSFSSDFQLINLFNYIYVIYGFPFY